VSRTAATMPPSCHGRSKEAATMTETTDGGVVSLPGEGQTTRLFGDTYTIKAAGRPAGRSRS
jgi:hypothetical protein